MAQRALLMTLSDSLSGFLSKERGKKIIRFFTKHRKTSLLATKYCVYPCLIYPCVPSDGALLQQFPKTEMYEMNMI